MTAELESVVLNRDLPEHELKAGDVGTVVFVYPDGSQVEVEFVNGAGGAVAVLPLPTADVRPMRPDEIHHVRAVSSR